MEFDTQRTGPQGTPAAPQRQPVTNAETAAPQPPEHVDAPILPRAALVAFFRSWRGKRCRSMLGDKATVLLAKTVYVQAMPEIAKLVPNRKVTARDLFGADEWPAHTLRYRICTGIFIAFLVSSTDLLPLRMHKTRSGSGTKKYWPLLKALAPMPSRHPCGTTNPINTGAMSCPL